MKLPENADSENKYEVEMTKACEKLFKKLTKREQKAVDERISDIQMNPSQGDYLHDKDLKGLLHTHARGKSSNLIIIWSVEKKFKKIIVEAVGPHKIIEWLTRRK